MSEWKRPVVEGEKKKKKKVLGREYEAKLQSLYEKIRDKIKCFLITSTHKSITWEKKKKNPAVPLEESSHSNAEQVYMALGTKDAAVERKSSHDPGLMKHTAFSHQTEDQYFRYGSKCIHTN